MEDKIKKIYGVVTETPKLKDAFTGITEAQFREALKDEKAQDALYDDLVAYDLVTKGDPAEFWTKKGLRQPKVAAPPISQAPPQQQARPVGVLAPPSLTERTAQQAVQPMAEQPVFQPFVQFKNEAELQQSAKSPVFKDFGAASAVMADREQMDENNPLTWRQDQQTGKFGVFEKNDFDSERPLATFDTKQQADAAIRTRNADNEGLIMPFKDAEADFAKMSPEQQKEAIQGSTGSALAESKKPKPTLLQQGKQAISDIASSFNRSVFKAPSAIAKTVSELGTGAYNLMGGDAKVEQDYLYQIADKYDKWIDDSEFAKEFIGDKNVNSLAGDVGSGLGQIATMVAAGGGSVAQGLKSAPSLLRGVAEKFLTPASGVAFSQVFSSEFDNMKAKGESDNTALKQALANAFVSSPLESIPLINLAERMGAVNPTLTRKVMNTLAQGVDEATQESIQQIFSNLSNNQLAQLETSMVDWSEGVQRSGEAGGLVGLLLGAVGQARTKRTKTPAAAGPSGQPPTQLGGIPTIPAPPNAPEFTPKAPVAPDPAKELFEINLRLSTIDRALDRGEIMGEPEERKRLKNRKAELEAQIKPTEAANVVQSETETETSPTSGITFENAKEGDVVLQAGKPVTVVGRTKSRGGMDVIEVKQAPRTIDEIKQTALQNVFNRVASQYGNRRVTWADIEANHPVEVRKAIDDETALERSRTATFTIDAEQWANEVTSENESPILPAQNVVANEEAPVADQAQQNLAPEANQPVEAGGTSTETGESGRPVVEGEDVSAEVVEEEGVITPEGFTNRVFESNMQLGEAPENAHISEEGFNYRVLSQNEIDAIRESGGVYAREGKQKGGNKNTKYWTKGNNKNWYGDKGNLETIRVKQGNFKENEVVRAEDVEVYNKETGKFEPLIKAKPAPAQTPAQQVATLRAEEQAEYDAMPDPNDVAKREEIYGRYDKLIREAQGEKAAKAGSVGVGGDVENTDITNLRKAKTKSEVEAAILKATQSDNLKDGLDSAENLIGKAMYKAVFYSDPIKFANELADAIEKIDKKKQSLKATPQAEAPKPKGKEGFTEGKDLTKIFAASKAKYGEKEGAKYNDAANRLVNPNTSTIIEVRSNGVVVKEGDKYFLKPFTNTDANSKKWTLGKPIEVTEQYVVKEKPAPLTKEEGKEGEKTIPQLQKQFEAIKKKHAKYLKKDGGLKSEKTPKEVIDELVSAQKELRDAVKKEREQRVAEDKRDTGLSDGINRIKSDKTAFNFVERAMKLGLVPDRLFNEFGKNLLHIKTEGLRSDELLMQTMEILQDFEKRENVKPDDAIAREIQRIENLRFAELESDNEADLNEVVSTPLPTEPSPFATFDTKGEDARKVREALKQEVGPEMFRQMQLAHKNAEKILRSFPESFKIDCP
jgi:hypothetical protein